MGAHEVSTAPMRTTVRVVVIALMPRTNAATANMPGRFPDSPMTARTTPVVSAAHPPRAGFKPVPHVR